MIQCDIIYQKKRPKPTNLLIIQSKKPTNHIRNVIAGSSILDVEARTTKVTPVSIYRCPVIKLHSSPGFFYRLSPKTRASFGRVQTADKELPVKQLVIARTSMMGIKCTHWPLFSALTAV
jgi:hypothetical protein